MLRIFFVGILFSLTGAYFCDENKILNCCKTNNFTCKSCQICIDSTEYCNSLQAMIYDEQNCLAPQQIYTIGRHLQDIQLMQLTMTFLSDATDARVRTKIAQELEVNHNSIAVFSQNVNSTHTQSLLNALNANVLNANEYAFDRSFKVHILFDSNEKVKHAFNKFNVFTEDDFTRFMNHASSKPILSTLHDNTSNVNGTMFFFMYLSIIMCIISLVINPVLRKYQK